MKGSTHNGEQDRVSDSEISDPETPLKQKKSIMDRVKKVISLIDIEPSLLVHMTASFMGNLLQKNLLLYKACHLNLEYPKDLCEMLIDKSNRTISAKYEEEVQEITEGIAVWSSVLDNLFPILFVLFLGAWTDVYGRKLPYLLSILGYIVKYIGLILAVYFENLSTEATAVISSLPVALTGSRIAISMVIYSYVTDSSSIVDRTLKMGMATAVRTFGKSLGSALGGNLNKGAGLGYYEIFAIAAGLDFIGLLYVVFFLKNIKNPNIVRSKSTWVKIKHIFNLNGVKDTLVAFFRKRDGVERTILFLLVVALMGTMIPMQAEESLLYQYTRVKFDWDAGIFGSYNTFRMILAFIGGISSVGILSRTLKLSDPTIGILSCFSQIASSFIYAFAHEPYMMYIAPVVDMLNGTMIIASRSMISKVVSRNEIGKINSFVAIIDSLTPLPASPAYNAIYQATLDSFPGAIFLISATVTIPPLIIFSILGCFMKVDDSNIVPDHRNSGQGDEVTLGNNPNVPWSELQQQKKT